MVVDGNEKGWLRRRQGSWSSEGEENGGQQQQEQLKDVEDCIHPDVARSKTSEESEAEELVRVFSEASGKQRHEHWRGIEWNVVKNFRRERQHHRFVSFAERSATAEGVKKRLGKAVSCRVGKKAMESQLPWSMMTCAVSVDEVKYSTYDDERREEDTLVEVSSGGTVFFCLFEPAGPGEPERCLVLKFISDRLLCQSEQFAGELANHLQIAAPESRLLPFGDRSGKGEWNELLKAAERAGKACEYLRHTLVVPNMSILILEYIPGDPLCESEQAFSADAIVQTSFDIGKIFALDMILGNPDRLRCKRLSWPGNKSNLIYATRGRFSGHVVAIDAVVQRKPPYRLISSEDAACEELAELAVNDEAVVQEILNNVFKSGNRNIFLNSMESVDLDAARACQNGMKTSLKQAMSLRGIFETLHSKIDSWICELIKDIEQTHSFPTTPRERQPSNSPVKTLPSPYRGAQYPAAAVLSVPPSASFTKHKILAIQKEATKDEDLRLKFNSWNGVYRTRCAELRAALEEWQSRHMAADKICSNVLMPLSTGFLEGTRPVVDMYELKVRLDHMLGRISILQQALSSAHPTGIVLESEVFSSESDVYISGAVAANSFHVLKHIGITHLLNATEDLFVEGDPRTEYIEENFSVLRIPLRDTEDEAVSHYFETAAEFIDGAVKSNGKVLVHCHAGQSRSCCLVLAWMMLTGKVTLRSALMQLHNVRPQAAPNAGYMNALRDLEEKTLGKKTFCKVKKSKPELRACPLCSERVGISEKSVIFHIKRKHPNHPSTKQHLV